MDRIFGGKPLLSELTRSVQGNLEVSFLYQGRNDDNPEERKVEPAGMYFQDNRWYLQAYDLKREAVRTFRLGRMNKLRVSDRVFIPKISFSADKAGFHKWDISENKPVVLKFSVTPDLARWFEENKPHPTITIKDNVISIKVKNQKEFLRWFSSLDGAELISPAKYRTWLGKRFTMLGKKYLPD